MIDKVAVLASGNGTTAEAFIRAGQAGIVTAEVGLVVCNNKEAGIFERIKSLNKEYDLGIETLLINGTTHPDVAGAKGEQTLAESAAIAEAIAARGLVLVLLLGYMKKVRGDLLSEYGAQPTHKSVYEARMLNTHPGPLPETKGTYGIYAQQKVIELELGYSAQTLQLVAADYDSGTILAEHRVRVKPNDTDVSLFAKVQKVEKKYLPVDVGKFLNHGLGLK